LNTLGHRFLIFLAVTSVVLAQTFELSAQTITLPNEDRVLLSKIQKDSAQYFIEQTNPETGLTKDSSQNGAPASIAATGFAVASFAIASSHGWISNRDAYRKIMKTMDTLEQKSTGKNGFFYHFLDPETAKRTWSSEVSSIDTALFFAGALLAATYFQGTELEARVEKLYEEVDWNWMLNGTRLFSHGWKPTQGFLPYYWDQYSEHLILEFLALGSATHPVPENVWTAWKREKETYNGKEIVNSYSGSLFTYQYSHAFIDFRNLNDNGVDYFDNSQKATVANREFSLQNQTEFQTYKNFWGLSACLGPDGYKAYGALPGVALHDGTIATYAAIASIVFTPDESISNIRALYKTQEGMLYGSYGFKEAFNLDKNWWAREYLGIDQGIIVLMLENFLNDEMVWKRFMRLPAIDRAAKRANLI
jgi:hypothetical protein